MRSACYIGILASLFSHATNLCAQSLPNWYDPSKVETANTMKEISLVGDCIAKKKPAYWMDRFQSLPLEGADKRRKEGNRRSGLQTRTCVASVMPRKRYTVNNRILAGSIAQGYYLQAHPKDMPSYGPYKYQNAFNAVDDLDLGSFFNCIFESNPASVDRLIRMIPGGIEENSLIDNIAVEANDCAPREKAFVIGRQWMRFGLAEVLFRRSLAVREPINA